MRFALATILAGAVTAGGCLGGLINAYDAYMYDSALKDPSFFYLVDKDGEPVSQEINESLN